MRLLPILLIVVLLSGCATYRQEIDEGLQLAHQGEWQGAEEKIDKALSSRQDTLLNLLERGALAQYQGDFERSNQLLEEAERISDTFFAEQYSSRSWALLTNPRQGDYKGAGFERVYISYFKSLNYLALADQETSFLKRQQLLDAALVESRRIDLKLNEIAAQNSSYEQVDDKNKGFFEKSLNWLAGFYTGGVDPEIYSYREDAWARYLEGVQYEASGEFDDARIAYQKSAELYEQGYAEQYDLPDGATQRAWLDTIRMMQKAGGWEGELPRLIDEKLSSASQAQLQAYQAHDAEVVVLEHQGFIPERQELNLILAADPYSQSLVLQPQYGTRNVDIEEDDAFRWFTMVYADTNPLNMLANYKAGKGWATFTGLFTKRIILGPVLWQQMDAVGVGDMLEYQPVRITVPYYNRFDLNSSQGQLSGGDQQAFSQRMTSLADIAVQEQLRYAHRDIYEALARELLRAWLAYEVSRNIDDRSASLLVGFVSQVAVFASSAAETRNWLTLPAQIRLTRMPVDSGLLTTEYKIGDQHFKLDAVQLNSGQVKVWNIRNPN